MRAIAVLKSSHIPLSPRDFEARRLHNLRRLWLHAKTPDERANAAAAVCRAVGPFLAMAYGLQDPEESHV